MKIKKVKCTITATDSTGREESITIHLDASTANRLEKAAKQTNTDGQTNSELREALSEIEEKYEYNGTRSRQITKSQYYRLLNFEYLIHNKFYKYTLTLTTD